MDRLQFSCQLLSKFWACGASCLRQDAFVTCLSLSLSPSVSSFLPPYPGGAV